MNKRYKYCFKEGAFVEYNAQNDISCGETEEKLSEIVFDRMNCTVLTDTAAIYKEINEFFLNLPTELRSLNLTQKNYKKTIDVISNIVKQTQNVCKKLIRKNCDVSERSCENIDIGSEHVLSKLEAMNTTFKMKKIIRQNPLFVQPVDKSIGLKWKNAKVNQKTQIPDHGLVETTFQYVPIEKTLISLFENKSFFEQYKKYNQHEKHKCTDGVFEDFCCGSVYKSKDIFNDPLAIQLQLGNDDFKVCCPVKSKATKHKINATYIQIKNMPIEYKSKLDNIYLVALCSTVNFKSQEYDYNHVAELIVDEISKLETEGIKIGTDILKGTLINISCDNLGANSVFGFVESFVANFFCRHCECSKSECHTMIKENKRKRRTKKNYESHVERANNKNIQQDFTATKGIKKSCKFNDLKYFHVLDNMSVDVMHDINEGVIAYCLHDFFNLIVKKKILAIGEIQKRVRDFNYGNTQKYNKPSLINVDKHNLNQNASQLYCLMVNMPFIFLDVREQIEENWEPVQTLLKCMQIIYSPSINESDIKSLEKYIQQHLKSVIEVFKRNISPKHHFLLHYPECIRRMGPPIHLWTMRFESKHKVLTEIARKKMNFINLPKMLAFEHQEQICKPPVFSAHIKLSESYGQFKNSMQFQKFNAVIERDIGTDLDEIRVHKFATYDNIEYREGCLLIENQRIYEIVNILSIDSNVFFICEQYKVSTYNQFCNSLKIEKPQSSAIVINYKNLQNKIVYDKMYAKGQHYLRADKLVVANLMK